MHYKEQNICIFGRWLLFVCETELDTYHKSGVSGRRGIATTHKVRYLANLSFGRVVIIDITWASIFFPVYQYPFLLIVRKDTSTHERVYFFGCLIVHRSYTHFIVIQLSSIDQNFFQGWLRF